MTNADITRELRATRPVASGALRARVAEIGERPTATARPRSSFRRHRLLALVPATAAIAVAGALVIGLTRPGSPGEPTLPIAVESPAGSVADERLSAPTPPAAETGAPSDRAQRVTAALTVRVDDGDALSGAAADALRITRELGGYVLSSRVVSGEDGSASLALRVPAAAAQEAIERLSALGTIVDQQVQVDDLQATLDALEIQLRQARAALASVRARLEGDDLTPAERARLQARRDELQRTLASLRTQRAETSRQAAEATIQLELRTAGNAGVVPVPTRLDRTIDRALDVLAWEAVTVLGLAIVIAPLVLVAGVALAGRRVARRREDARLLGAA
jgi:Domain of unknown function (DUF4349)